MFFYIYFRLIEWIEFLKVFGVGRIFFHILKVHKNIKKVLHHYESERFADLKKIEYLQHGVSYNSDNGDKINYKRRQELITYNDCVYRNLYSYQYIALLDVDEMIVPQNHRNWSDMMKVVESEALEKLNKTRASWNFRTVYFLDTMTVSDGDLSDGLHMLHHINRSSEYIKPVNYYDKTIFNPDTVLLVHNHYPLSCLGGKCLSHPVSPSLGHVHHYRASCPASLRSQCINNSVVTDTSLWRWRQEMITNFSKVKKKLNL